MTSDRPLMGSCEKKIERGGPVELSRAALKMSPRGTTGRLKFRAIASSGN